MSAPECEQPRGERWATCIEFLADGFINVLDLCPVCTRAVMNALDGIAGPLVWHPTFRDRAAGEAPNAVPGA